MPLIGCLSVRALSTITMTITLSPPNFFPGAAGTLRRALRNSAAEGSGCRPMHSNGAQCRHQRHEVSPTWDKRITAGTCALACLVGASYRTSGRHAGELRRNASFLQCDHQRAAHGSHARPGCVAHASARGAEGRAAVRPDDRVPRGPSGAGPTARGPGGAPDPVVTLRSLRATGSPAALPSAVTRFS
jgi:hypothetical protein